MDNPPSDSRGNGPAAIGDIVSPVLERFRATFANSPSAEEMDRRATEAEARRQQQRLAQLVSAVASALGPRYSPELATLDKFAEYHPNQKPVLAKLRSMVGGLGEFVAGGGNLIFLGSVGTGKDHLLASMLYLAAAKGAECGWINGQELFGAFYDRMDTGKADEEHFRELCRPQVLGISDPIPPHGQPKEWELRNLYRVLDRRYRAMKCTWVTVNAASVDDADRQLSEPVFDRLRDGAEILSCFWPSYRERKRP